MPAFMYTTREQVFTAFFNLASSATGFASSNVSRKFVHWDQVVGAGQMPFMTMLEFGEQRIRQTDGTPIIKLYPKVLIYTVTGDPTVVPGVQMNNLLDALDLAVRAVNSDIMENRQTLGGLVYDCYPLGRTFVDAGDVDGKGVAVVPFEILLPWFV
jgi:hypothetical protein